MACYNISITERFPYKPIHPEKTVVPKLIYRFRHRFDSPWAVCLMKHGPVQKCYHSHAILHVSLRHKGTKQRWILLREIHSFVQKQIARDLRDWWIVQSFSWWTWNSKRTMRFLATLLLTWRSRARSQNEEKKCPEVRNFRIISSEGSFKLLKNMKCLLRNVKWFKKKIKLVFFSRQIL